ncbi:hypothetical protein HYX04_01870 [Candidatus Woesearchaeota archaeon]|nr:hypothetical protein [Candidatus Woesearchaeota archaeon]
MKGVISQKHLALNEKLAKESNKLAGNFNNKLYSKISDIDAVLLKRGVSVEKKKNILMGELHGFIVKTFSIDKKRFGKRELGSLKKRLHTIRKIIIRLRSINYYLETTFLKGLNTLKIRTAGKSPKIKRQNSLARDELEMLEYAAYNLIRKVVVLDKRLLREYSSKERKVLGKEKINVNDIGLVLKKESELLEHLEAKLPPPKAATIALMREPIFTHWIARIFALLSYFEHIYAKEAMIFGRIKKNKLARSKINRKISYLIKEKSKMVMIMQEKAASMKQFGKDNRLKRELHDLTTAMGL